MFLLFCKQSAVQYRGKYLYEELVEKSEFDSRQNEESYLMTNINRIDATFRESNSLRRYDGQCQINESVAECDEDKATKNYLLLTLRELLISITLHLYKFSRNYRYVHEILSKEKKMLKLKGCEYVKFIFDFDLKNMKKILKISKYFAVKAPMLMSEPISLHINIQFYRNSFKHCGLH